MRLMGRMNGERRDERNTTMNMRDLNKTECDDLEMLVDRCGLSSVLMALSEICGSKAEHIATNWQDASLAKDWATLEGRIGVIVPTAVCCAL